MSKLSDDDKWHILRNFNSPWNGSKMYNNQNNITQEKLNYP